MAELWAVSLVLFAGLIGSFGPLFLKKGSAYFTTNPLQQIKNYNLMLGIGLYVIATILFIPALKGGDLSVLYPLISTTYVWVSLWSMWFLREKMTRIKWAGIVLIIIGISLIGIGS